MKMEDGLKGIDGVTDSTISFATKKLKLTFDGEREAEIVAKGHELISSIEPEVVMKPVGKGSLKVTATHGSAEPTGFEKVKLAVAAAGFWQALLPFPDGVSNMLLVFAMWWRAEVVEHSLRNVMRGEVFDEFSMLVASLRRHRHRRVAGGCGGHGVLRRRRVFSGSGGGAVAAFDCGADGYPSGLGFADGGRRGSPSTSGAGEGGSGSRCSPGKILLDGGRRRKFFVDTSTLTGSLFPAGRRRGRSVVGLAESERESWFRCRRSFGSTVSRILALVEEAAEKKASSERFITRFARVYTPVVVFGACSSGWRFR